MQPALFIGHGSPMNALGENTFAESLAALGRGLARPAAVLVVSAHWETPTSEVLNVEHPATIHDFYGFPPELYRIRYPAPGAPALARRVEELLGADVKMSANWGFDHGAWSVLRHLFPAADVPTTALSLAQSLGPRAHYALAQKLVPLRDENVLLVATGNIVHNLRDFAWNVNTAPFDWAVEFDRQIAEALQRRDLDVLLDFKGLDPALVRRALPSMEHYTPLIYALGMSHAADPVSFPFTAMQNGSVAMRSVRFG